MDPTSTLARIHQAAQEEFLAKGFQRASLRSIVRSVGMTTGAFYGYYKSKEALFASLVQEPYEFILHSFQKAQEDFAALPWEEQPQAMEEISGRCMEEILHYAYDHLDQCRLLLCCAEGTPFAGLIDEMVEIEVRSTHAYQKVLDSLGRPSPAIDPRLEHILITGMFHTFFELVIHEMPLGDAENYVRDMRAFYTAGWMKIMGQRCPVIFALWLASANFRHLFPFQPEFHIKGGIVMKSPSNLSRLLGAAGRHRYLIYASWALSAVSALLALVPYYFIWRIIKEVLETAPAFSRAQHLVYHGGLAVLFAVLAILVYIAGLMCSHLGSFRVATNLRIQVMEHIVTLPLGFAEAFGSGKLRKIVNESSAATETYLAHQLPDRAGAIATPCGLLVLLLVFDWRLGLLSLAPVLLGFLIMLAMTGPQMRQKMKEYQDALEDMSNEAVEYVRGIPVVKTFGQTVFSFTKFKGAIDRYKTWVIAYTKQLRTPMMLYTTAINGVFVFLIAGGLLLTRHGVTPDFLLNIIFYIIITPIISLTLTKIMFQSENAMIVADALQRIDSVLELAPLAEPAQPRHPRDSSVVLEDIHFRYTREKEVLQGISLSISPGQTVALVGPSGCGKTTLANLIARFSDPQTGTVRIGGVDVRDMAKEELMNTVSFVFQNSRLLKASLLDNVRLGRPDASREEVLAALERAECGDILKKLPQGMDTVIGADGVYLSGGEQQRIAIARVMLKNTPIVILDEATAFADPDNESKVQAAFSALSQGKTVIMIAHRLSTIAGADRIYVVKDGQIAEEGPWKTLMEKDGLFARMWQTYQTSTQWKVTKEAL